MAQEEPASGAPPVPPWVIGLCLILAVVLAIVFLRAAQVVQTP